MANLRYATYKENNQNRSMRNDNTSGVKGVSWRNDRKKWCAEIYVDGIHIYLGCFDNIDDAKKARIKKVNEAFGTYINSCEK